MDIDWVIVGNLQYPAPNLASIPSSISICPADFASYPIGFVGDTCTLDADRISWSTGASSPSIVATGAGKYTITVVNYGGTATKDITVTVPQYTKAGLSYSIPSTNQLQVTDGSSGPVTSYSWYYFPKTVNPTSVNPSVWGNASNATGNKAVLLGTGVSPSPFVGSNYSFNTWVDSAWVCLRTQAGLAGTTCYQVSTNRGACQRVLLTILSLEDFNSSNTNVYPTLVENYLNVVIGEKLSGQFETKITDMAGTLQAASSIGAGLNVINVSQFPAGAYLINISQGNKTLTRRFIKQ